MKERFSSGFHNGPPSWTMAGKGGPYKVFVGGLPQECTTEVLSDYFSTFGMLTDVVVMSDRGTGRSRGFGFVSFDTVEPVEQIMAMHKEHQIMGKWIDCKNATVEGTKGAGGGMGAMGGMGGMGKGGAGASGGMKGAGKPGDWKCPNCGALVFGSKSECFKCGTPKPDSSYGATSYGGYAAIAPPSSCGGGCSGGGAGYGGGSYGGGAAAYGSVGGNIGGGGGWTGKGCLGAYGAYGKDGKSGKGYSPY